MRSAPGVAAILQARLAGIVPLSVSPHDGHGEWFVLESPMVDDLRLYRLLKSKWRRIFFSDGNQFALIYCENGPGSGIWLHDLSAVASGTRCYPGCHHIESWETERDLD